MPAIDLSRALNAEQYAAATAPDGPLLVLAAAGTGKTRTLTYRVAWLILERGIDPARILLLTFTNKAAREMLERADALVQRDVGGLWGGTFHHMANRILRRHARAVGLAPDYTILDQEDAVAMVKQSVRDCGLADREFIKPAVLQSLQSYMANAELPLGAAMGQRLGPEWSAEEEAVGGVLARYTALKRKQEAVDFDDLLVQGLRLFQEHPEILREYQERFLYTLVDEYQDTNTIQAQWVDLVAAGHRNLLVVGDDFQSIYSWRGADYRNILTFPERYPDARTYRLETNYRSVPEILDVANACIRGNPQQFQKTLRSTRDAYKRPVLARVRDGDHQARYVVDQIRRMRREGYRLDEVAVLYRAHFHAMELQMLLQKEGIPFVITSGMRFFEQAHVKDALCILRMLHNPGDALAFSRLVMLLPKVGARTADRLWQKVGGRCDLRQPGARAALAAALPDAAREPWRRLDPVLDLAARATTGEEAGEVLREFCERFYKRYAEGAFENGDRRLDDLNEMALFVARYPTLEQLLSELALMTNMEAEASNGNGGAGPAVRLSTVHQAKGLEWSVVFVLWAVDGMFPSSKSLDDSLEGEAEERRLFYVAVTRARDELFLCVPEVRRMAQGGVLAQLASRFIREIPRALLQEQRVGFL